MDETDPSEIKILVASDIHLGFSEKDNVRGRDSIDSFEEVLKIAEEKRADMLLLGGDLFHENKPSRTIFFACTELLRKYCMNNRPVSLEFLSDASLNFSHSKFPLVNYMDPNLNIGLPVFSINGNHDDLSGVGLSALDQLHATGLINYFGKYQNLDKLEVSPILLRKKNEETGIETKIALYGIGSIRDERLNRMFQQGRVSFLTFGDKDEQKSWNNILVLHQNRVRHGPSNYIPESMLPDFMDFIIWGHEHQCRIEPEESSVGFKIMQPGSTVATSLAEGEAGEKCVSLLRITGTTITDEKIPLKTVRPFYFESFALSDLDIKPGRLDTVRQVEKFCEGRVQNFLRKAKEEHPNNHRSNKPLIRLRVDYSGGYDIFNIPRFGSKFTDVVANPRDLVLFHRKRETKEPTNVDVSVLNKVLKQNAHELRNRVEDLVKMYFANADKSQKLLLLTDNALGSAVREFVQKDEKDAIDEMVKQQLQQVQKKVEERVKDRGNPDEIKRALEEIRDLRLQNRGTADQEEQNGIQAALENSRRRRIQGEFNGTGNERCAEDDLAEVRMDDDNDQMDNVSMASDATPLRGRGSRSRSATGRGRGSRGGRGRGVSADATPESTPSKSRGRPRGSISRGRGRGRGAVKRPFEDDDDDDVGDAAQNGNHASTSKGIGRYAVKRGMGAPAHDEVEISDDDDF